MHQTQRTARVSTEAGGARAGRPEGAGVALRSGRGRAFLIGWHVVGLAGAIVAGGVWAAAEHRLGWIGAGWRAALVFAGFAAATWTVRWLRAPVGSRRLLVSLATLTFILHSVLFAPFEWWPAAYVCLVPWVVGLCLCARRGAVLAASYLLGVAFYFFNMYWMWDVAYVPIGVGGEGGEPLRFPAGTLAVALYFGLYFPLLGWGIRQAWRRRRVPLTVAVPVLVVAMDLLRSVGPLGFPWFFLAHSHYRILPAIQISDMFGAYGVTFVIAMVNGWLADVVLAWAGRRGVAAVPGGSWRVWGTGAVAAGAVVGSLAYGVWRLRTAELSPGPRVAVIQGNFVLDVSLAATGPGPLEKRETYFGYMEAARREDPAVYVLPESPWVMVLNPEYVEREVDPSSQERYLVAWSQQCYERFREFAESSGAVVVVGGQSVEDHPQRVYPQRERFNSAFVFYPDRPRPLRYDKVHLLLFGEYVPFRGGRLHSVYLWLNSITPWGQGGFEYSCSPGREFRVFTLPGEREDGRAYRFGIPICYEDAMPYVSRRFTRGDGESKGVDFLLNISNDGWFRRRSELTQHLAVCVFRAVENRVGIARAVNTGISGFIDPNGRIYGCVSRNGRLRGEEVEGYSVAAVMLDRRYSFYTRYGDLFALACLVGGLLVVVDAALAGWRRSGQKEAGA